jgi:glucose/arabinose dehydrogenase
MKNIYTSLVSLALLAACGNPAPKQETAAVGGADSAVKKETVETNPPNSDYKPAFEGQTRIAKVTTKTPYTVTRLAENIGHPWSINPLPDGRFLVLDKTGFGSIYGNDGKMIMKITGFPKVDDSGQGGLLDFALDPDFSKNHMIYFTFSEPYGKGNLTAVAKGVLDEAKGKMTTPTVIFRALPALESDAHYGGRLLFDKDGNIFVSAGERAILDGRKQAQWLNAGMGKVFHITKEGKPVAGNPFIGKADAMPEIYSYGHRNPQSLDINPQTGELWEAEFGPRGGDELNRIQPGKNYGWPIITYGIEYDGRKIGDSIQQKEGMEQPVYYWDPVVSPSGMMFYTGDAIPEWKNNLFIGGLSSMQIIRLVIENNKVVGEESLLKDQKERIRDITQLNGSLYAVSDGGVFFKISKQ